MVQDEKERRRFHRVFFSLEEGIKGTLAFSRLQQGLLTAHIINLSEGGLGLVLGKAEKERIRKGYQVILTHIKGIQGLEPLVNVKAEIKWILDNPSLEFMGFGCEFINLPESMRDAIRTFIDARARER
jgi:c-di-GMP-binding flagellar brake protein YcgR